MTDEGTRIPAGCASLTRSVAGLPRADILERIGGCHPVVRTVAASAVDGLRRS